MIKQTVVAWDGHITLEPVAEKVVVSVGGVEVLSTNDAVALTEGGAGPTYYLPRKDLVADQFVDSDLTTFCPWKGEARYLHYEDNGERVDNIVWAYPEPKEEIPELADYLAFYPSKAEIRVG